MKRQTKPYRGQTTGDRLCNGAVLALGIVFAILVAAACIETAARGANAKIADVEPTAIPLPPVVEYTTVEVAEMALPELVASVEVDEPAVTEAEREPEMTLLGRYKVVGYNYLDAAQCGKVVADGITASGEPAVHGKTAAMAGVPFGTVLYIDGYGFVTVNDRGVSGKMVDVAFDNNADCFAITGWYDVYVVEELK